MFVDTSALYAHVDENDGNHERARAIFDGIRTGDLVYRPLYVTSHVLGELATLTMHAYGPDVAIDTIDRLQDSSLFEVLHASAAAFETACEQLASYDDQQITLVDHLTAVLADERTVGQVFTFDADFRMLGFTLVPEDVPAPRET